MGRNIKTHKSSVVCCEIDPSSLFVLSGSTDLRFYVSSCFIASVDDSHLKDKTLAQDFGQVIYEFPPNCWLSSIAWNASGSLGFAVGQNSNIAVINYKDQKTDVIRCKHSPMTLIVLMEIIHFMLFAMIEIFLNAKKKETVGKLKKLLQLIKEKNYRC